MNNWEKDFLVFILLFEGDPFLRRLGFYLFKFSLLDSRFLCLFHNSSGEKVEKNCLIALWLFIVAAGRQVAASFVIPAP